MIARRGVHCGPGPARRPFRRYHRLDTATASLGQTGLRVDEGGAVVVDPVTLVVMGLARCLMAGLGRSPSHAWTRTGSSANVLVGRYGEQRGNPPQAAGTRSERDRGQAGLGRAAPGRGGTDTDLGPLAQNLIRLVSDPASATDPVDEARRLAGRRTIEALLDGPGAPGLRPPCPVRGTGVRTAHRYRGRPARGAGGGAAANWWSCRGGSARSSTRSRRPSRPARPTRPGPPPRPRTGPSAGRPAARRGPAAAGVLRVAPAHLG